MGYKRILLKFDIWNILSSLMIILITIPSIVVLFGINNKQDENWLHIKKFLLKDYTINSIKLVIITTLIVTILGVLAAWLITFFKFPMSRFFKWALILPISIPAYIGAYTYNGILDYTGIVQVTLRNRFGISVDPGLFDIMNIKGAVFIFCIFLYPYVYLITKSSMEKISRSIVESARTLKANHIKMLFTIVVPMSRLAIVGSAVLVILEILNDYGVVQYFGIPTFSTAIFKSWFGMGDIYSALKLSSILMVAIFVILLIERVMRGRKSYSHSNSKVAPIEKTRLSGVKGILATSYCLLLLSVAFIIPMAQLVTWSIKTYSSVDLQLILSRAVSSIGMAFLSAVIIIIISLIIGNFVRLNNNIVGKVYSKLTVLGHSVPGAVIAIGIIVIFIFLDRRLSGLYQYLGIDKSLVLSTSIYMLLFAYVVRFLAIGYNNIDAGYGSMGLKFLEASNVLGKGTLETFIRVDIPLLKNTIISGFILVFIDVLKELPLTLILRPFNFDTLATTVYQYASDEMIHEAAFPALIIILISALLTLIINQLAVRRSNNAS